MSGQMRLPDSLRYPSSHLPSHLLGVVKCGQVWSSVVSTRSPSRLTPRTLHLWPLQSGFCEICSCANVLQFNIFCFLKGEGVERGHLDMRNQDRTRYHCSENVFCKLYVLYTVYCNTEIGMFSIHKRWKNVQTLLFF